MARAGSTSDIVSLDSVLGEVWDILRISMETWGLGTWSLRCTNSDVIIIIHYYYRHHRHHRHHNHRHHVKRQCSAPVLMIEFGKFWEKLNCWRQKVPTKKTSLHRRQTGNFTPIYPQRLQLWKMCKLKMIFCTNFPSVQKI